MATAEAETITPTPDTPLEPDPDTGKLFDTPRTKVNIDDSDPDHIPLAFSGSIDLDRSKADDVRVYNQLAEGEETELHLTVRISGAKTSRKLKDGYVDKVTATKQIVITDIHHDHA